MITYRDFRARLIAPVEGQSETAADVPAEAVKPPLGERLKTVCGKAVDRLDAILELPLDPEHPSFGNVLRSQNAAITTALTTQVRVDEVALRKQVVDRMPEIMKLVREVEKALPPPGEIDLEADNYGEHPDG
jgi:hypothetical protein